MYLSKIELFGFKSFAHRITIRFDKGLTAIVGPNGCGKTNVVDAIRWVLGEQKSALLRSTKMENIIFNGTRKLKPLSLSEVSLTIENTRNVLPIEYSEVTITRRIYRSGESEYLLNQVPCRLKDILDLFADTGMGSDAYSVIELKMIEEIISNKSDERLRLLEEAAGITRYKQRRKQTFRQLEITARDLERVDDVLSEVSKKVRNLKTQVRKAEKYHVLKTRLRELDLMLARLNLEEYDAKLEPLKLKIKAQNRENQTLSTTIALKDSRLQNDELRQLEQEQSLSEAQKIINTENERIHALEKKQLQLQEQEHGLKETIVRFSSALLEKKNKTQELLDRQQELKGSLAPLEAQCDKENDALQKLNAQLDTQNSRLNAARSELRDIRSTINNADKESAEHQIARHKIENSRDYLNTALCTMEQKTGTLQASVENNSAKQKGLHDKQARLSKEIDETRKEIGSMQAQKLDIARQIERNKEKLLEYRAEKDRLHNRIILANSILDNYEGLPEGIAYLETNPETKRGYGCLSDLISLDSVHRKAVNAALGESLGYYVCATTQEARAGIECLTRADKGKISFLVLERLAAHDPEEVQMMESATPVLSLIDAPETIRKALWLLLRYAYITQDLATAETLSRQHPSCTFVTPEGERIDPKGIIHGGSSRESEGLRLGKKMERDELLADKARCMQRIQDEEKTLQALNRSLQEIPLAEKERHLQALVNERNVLEKQLTQIDIEQQSRARELEQIHREIVEARRKLQTTEQELTSLLPKIKAIEEKNNERYALLREAQHKIGRSEEEHKRLSKEVQNRQNSYREAQLELDKIRYKITSGLHNIASFAEESDVMQQEISTAQDSVTRIRAEVESCGKELECMLVESAKRQQQSTELEARYRECKILNQETRNAVRELRRSHEIGLQLSAELQQKQMELERGIDNLITAVQTRYNCNLQDIDTEPPLDFNKDDAEKTATDIGDQLQKFGAVNELALEEYEQEKERLDFLTGQKEDLLGAERQLRTTIDEINKTALKKFEDTYNTVRGNFISIFRELFEETDEADLMLLSGDDPLEAHISIIAKPRGKKPLSIEQLSGGEKALTALSLLFSIYLVKPSPFCILDEVDAPLDDANVDRFIKLLKKFENNTQFIIVTHNKKTMASSRALYGVTMEEEGVSKLIPVKLEKKHAERSSGNDAE